MLTKLTGLALILAAAALAAEEPYRVTQRDRGTTVELSIRNVSGAAAALREGDSARFSVSLRDETTGSKLSGVYPKMWMVRSMGNAQSDAARRCRAQTAALLTGGFTSPAALDMNVYYVVALNSDGSITVVDPHFSFGGSQFLAMLQLENPGYDWALAAGNDRLYVTMPKSNKVAVVDTIHWKLVGTVDVGPNPRRIVGTADGQQLWVAHDRGVTALRADDASVVGTIATGKGEHDLALSADGRYLVVTNRDDGTATVLDANRRAMLASIPAGRAPLSAVFSNLSGMAYVAAEDGTVTVIDPKRKKAVATAAAKPGLTQIRIDPSGRFAFVANPVADVVQILDTASNRIIQTGAIDAGPFDVAFTDTIAYVRRLKSETVQMVPLAAIGKDGAQVPVVDFPAGEFPFGKAPRATAAAGIVAAPGESAVIIANPADKHVYYYKEGMAAPIGHFSNYGHFAQAVLVVDRSVKESRDAYGTTAVLPPANEYEVVVFVDAPRLVTCFPVAVKENPALLARKRGMPVHIEHLTSERVVAAGAPAKLAFRLRDHGTDQPRGGLDDAMVLIVGAGRSWFTRQPLAPADGGRYETEFVPPAAGVYYVYVGAPSIGLRTSNPLFLTLEAR